MAPPNPQKGNLEPLSVSGALQVEPGRLSQPAEQVGRARPARAGQPGRLVPPGRPVGCFARGWGQEKREGGAPAEPRPPTPITAGGLFSTAAVRPLGSRLVTTVC